MIVVGLLDHFMDLLGAIFLIEKVYKLARWWHRRKTATAEV